MQIQEYTSKDSTPLAKILYEAVHGIPLDIYDAEQQNAWAPDSILEEKRPLNKTWVCIVDEKIVGYIDYIPAKAYVDHLYVLPDYQGKGIAALLYETLEQDAIKLNIKKLTLDASKVILPFFLHRGYIIETGNIVERRGIKLINFTLCKVIY